jgi:hypothetical protein
MILASFDDDDSGEASGAVMRKVAPLEINFTLILAIYFA